MARLKHDDGGLTEVFLVGFTGIALNLLQGLVAGDGSYLVDGASNVSETASGRFAKTMDDTVLWQPRCSERPPHRLRECVRLIGAAARLIDNHHVIAARSRQDAKKF